jgi:hypothetical protein
LQVPLYGNSLSNNNNNNNNLNPGPYLGNTGPYTGNPSSPYQPLQQSIVTDFSLTLQLGHAAIISFIVLAVFLVLFIIVTSCLFCTGRIGGRRQQEQQPQPQSQPQSYQIGYNEGNDRFIDLLLFRFLLIWWLRRFTHYTSCLCFS